MLSEARVAEIERRLRAGESLRTVAAAERVGVSTVQRIAAGRRRIREASADRKTSQRRSPGRPSGAAATIWCEGCKARVVPVNGGCLLCRVRALKREERRQAA